MARQTSPQPASVDHESDGALVARILTGDSVRYAVLVRRYQERLFRHARGMTGDADTAADLVQDAFVKAYRHLDRCQDPERFGAWLFRILANRCKDHLRSPYQRAEALVHDTASVSDYSDPDRTMLRTEIRGAVEAALSALPAAQREAFLLKHLDGYSYDEMAALLKVSVPALKMRVLRAREALQERLRGLI